MSQSALPFILEPDQLEQALGGGDLVIVDLSRPDVYAKAHVPGARHLDYARVVLHLPPVMGLLPDEDQLSEVLSGLGITPQSHVVAYDDEGGGKACRFLWTLDVLGHEHMSLLNGGLHAWANEGHKLSADKPSVKPSQYEARIGSEHCADQDYIKSRLGSPNFALLDARSPAEFTGADARAEHNGHIPGAVNLEWMQALDKGRNLRLKPADELGRMLAAIGIIPDKEVVTYCHSHHRSALTYVVLKSLGYRNIKGYPGSWSDWGNSEDTPIE